MTHGLVSHSSVLRRLWGSHRLFVHAHVGAVLIETLCIALALALALVRARIRLYS